MSRNGSITAAVVMTTLLALVAGATAADNADTKKIEIRDRKFSLAKVSLKAGQTVVWTNRDDNDHQIVITLDGKKVKESDNLSGGDSFKFTFDKPGKYKFACKLHPREKGEITVE
jgi:plastocyanin